MLLVHHPHVWTSITALFVALWTGMAWWYAWRPSSAAQRRREYHNAMLGRPL